MIEKLTEGAFLFAACVIMVGCGVVLPDALAVGLDYGFTVWLIACFTAGLVLAEPHSLSVSAVIMRSMFSAALMPLTLLGHVSAEWFLAVQSHAVEAQAAQSGTTTDEDNHGPLDVFPLLIMGTMGTLATFLTTVLAAMSSSPLAIAASQLLKFSPQNLHQIRRVLATMTGVIGVTLIMWHSYRLETVVSS